MKTTLRLTPSLSALLCTVSLAVPVADSAVKNPIKIVQQPGVIGLAFDVGGKNDHSFNQAAWDGAWRAARDFQIKLDVFTPRTPAEVGKGVAPLAGRGDALVIGVGFGNKPGVVAAAPNFPLTRFAVIDDLPTGSNTTGLLFREQEGSFLGGAVAGLSSSTKVIGFIGGLDVPVISRFRAGFTAGVKLMCPECKVISVYVDKTPAGWNNPAKAKTLAADLQKKGADIIFAAAGGSGQGLVGQIKLRPCLLSADLPAGVKFAADPFNAVPRSAAENKRCPVGSRPTFFIGVDSNQNALGDFDKQPGTLNHGLTSVVKRVDLAVYNAIRDQVKGKHWFGGKQELGVSSGGVGYALDQYNRALISPAQEAKLKKLGALVGNGTIKVPVK
jgi:basic membrane protein A and related proteins